jgi:hypothetical protein
LCDEKAESEVACFGLYCISEVACSVKPLAFGGHMKICGFRLLHLTIFLPGEIFSDRSSFQVLDLQAMEGSRHWRIVGCSAYTGEGLLEGFDWLVQDIASRIYVLD